MSKLPGRLCLGLSVAVVAVSCGKPPTRGVTTQEKIIVAHQLSPNVMMLVDRSAAMTTNTSTASPCPSTIGGCGPGNACPAGCPTRIADLKTSVASMLNANGGTVRVGVSYFPTDASCGAANASSVLVPLLGPSLADDPVQNQMQASQANQALSGLIPTGGIPTADSLRFIGTQQELTDPDRQNFVMLFTNTFTGAAPSCSTSADTVAALTELRQKNIKTVVLAIGADVLSAADADTLNQMAGAGGFARACPSGTDAECGAGDTCNGTTKICNRSFYGADDAQQLTAQLLQMTTPIATGANVCTFPLEKTPASVAQLEVLVDQGPLNRCVDATGCNTWTFDAASNSVVFHGAICSKLQGATPHFPVDVTIRIFDP